MSQHYSEADLLETYYTQPGESLPVMMHLADCADCAARYERLEKKIRALGACSHAEKPETFWARQRISILRKVDRQRQPSSFARVTRVAAAAVLALVLGGVVLLDRTPVEPAEPAAVIATAEPAAAAATEITVPADPWESEELDDFQSIVAWESWDEKSGDQSL
ncbi:MAG TPA: hypothetical protein VHK90_18005 [Thermoanaerobaculia bacterium]|nr:hypothetical protein [Thermoanaerobaculia bacterium]